MDFGFFVLGSFREVSEILCLFLLFALSLNSLYSPWLIQFLYDLRGKSGKLKGRLYSEIFHGNFEALKDEEENSTKSNEDHVKQYREEECESHHSHSTDDDGEEDDEYDISSLRKMVKSERRRANAAVAEVAKERAASATAAEEAMAMIQRLQNEKSSIEMESSQYRRLAEEKLFHDQRVIHSLHCLLWRNANPNEDVLENVIYCS